MAAADHSAVPIMKRNHVKSSKILAKCSDGTVNVDKSSDVDDNYCLECNNRDKIDKIGVDFNMNKSDRLSEIQEFYNGKNVLITGATGFLGKILMEKLLRCCPGVENLYLLVRQKRGKDIYTRIEEVFDDPVFSRLKEEVPKFRHKIVGIPADCEAAGLGLTISDRQTLIEKVNIIFHSAATVKFDEHLRAALTTNVRAPLYLLQLAKDIKHLKVQELSQTVKFDEHLRAALTTNVRAPLYLLQLAKDIKHLKVQVLSRTVKFDEHLRAALTTNVRAPLYLLQLAKDIKHLKVFMHISTAYSNSHLYHIEEKFYPCEGDSENLQRMIDKLTDDQINDVLPTILGKWPNTYTFTKALAENELRLNATNVPLGIFRPAIVTSTVKEPLKCWLDNMYGPTGVAVGAVTGMLRTLQCDESVTADLVPVDSVVNCLMVAAHNVHHLYKSSPPPEPPIFNFVSSVENRITWGDFTALNMARIDKHPTSNAVWYFSLRLNKSPLMNQICMLFLHLLPAALVDGLAMCIGKKPKMLKVYRKIHKFSSVLSYFCTHEIEFCNRRTRALWESTSDLDKQLFPFSMSEVNWSTYFDEYLAGIRRYLFKETDDTLPQARIKWKRLYYLHQIVRMLFVVLVFYTFWSVLKCIF